jgi:hypothetical protein
MRGLRGRAAKMEPATSIGKVLGEIASILGALIITYILTRWQLRYLRKKHTPKVAAVYAFIWISLLTLIITSLTMGVQRGFFTYMPCLVFWLIRDIIRAKKIERGEIVEEDNPGHSDYIPSEKGKMEKRPIETSKEKWKWSGRLRTFGGTGEDKKE